jgi:hypothetical protein
MEGDDDRTAALVSASDLEGSIEQAISKRMRPLSTQEYNDLFFGDSPLATFSAKIKLGYALRIYGSETRTELDLIRDVRNAFAHSRRAISFSIPEVADICDLLRSYKQNAETQEIAGPKKKFVDSCYRIAIKIMAADVVDALRAVVDRRSGPVSGVARGPWSRALSASRRRSAARSRP